ncbi:MAG: replication-relaxation family protein [Pseudomonadota bacterium]
MERALRQGEAKGKIYLQDRDQRWIWAVYEYGLMTIDQAMLISGDHSRAGVTQRLRRLTDHKVFVRPDAAKKVYGYDPKRHVPHLLGQEGAKWLKEQGVPLASKKGYESVAKAFKGQNLKHDVGAIDFVLALKAAVAVAPNYAFKSQLDMFIEHDQYGRKKPGRLPTKRLRKGSLVDRATDPDYTFELHRTEADGRVRPGLCFLEFDNSTEDFKKAEPFDSSIEQKLSSYTYAYKMKLHTQQYGRKGFRVLFVINAGHDRVKKMQATYREHLEGRVAPGVFLFATVHDVELHGTLGGIWTNAAGERVGL